MNFPKIAIFRKYVLDAKGHFRFFGVTNAPKTKKQKVPIFQIGEEVSYNKKGQQYPNVVVYTEKQLVEFIKNNYGYGQYMVIAYLKGRKGTFVFWRGEINEDGWVFYNLEYDKNEVEELRKELIEADNKGDKEMSQFITEMLHEEISDAKNRNTTKRYGFAPFLKSSGRRGGYHMWDEPDQAFEQKSRFDRKRNFNLDNMSLDDINEI